MRVLMNQTASWTSCKAISLSSVVLLSKICFAFRPDYGEKRRAVYSPGSSEEQAQIN